MRIALPISNGRFSLHYGSAEEIALHDIDVEQGVATSVGMVSTPAEGMCGAGSWMAAQGIEVLIVGGIGAGAARSLGQAGIRVFAGIQEEDPEKVVTMILEGVAQARELAPGESMCQGHGEGGHGHHHGEGHACTCGKH